MINFYKENFDMLNKKTVFNIVYGLALVGVISACFGMLNEFLNVAQISGRVITNVGTYESWPALAYPRTAFIVCALATVVLLLCIPAVSKGKLVWIPNLCILIACVVVLILSLRLIGRLERFNLYGTPVIDNFNYTIIYAFRSVALSYVASAVTLFVCNIIHAKTQKRETANQVIEQEQA